MKVWATCVAAFALAVIAAPALANGRFPAAQHVIVGPAGDDRTIALRATFGVVLSDDHGASFHWICEDALGYGGGVFDPAITLDALGRLHVGVWNGATRLATDRCASVRTPSLEGRYLTDLDVTADGATVFAVTATGFTEATNHVLRSDDRGETFTALAGVPGVHFETAEVARSDSKRLYATGLQLSPRKVVVYRSDDAGATLRELTFPFPDAIGAYVSGIDPTKPDVVWIRVLVDTQEDSGPPRRHTVLLRSNDGGASFTELARTHGLMLGFAFSDDGRTLFHGGPDPLDGLHRSIDGGATWTRIGDAHVRCLRHHRGALYVCGTEELDGWALARSADQGQTLQPILQFGRIDGPPSCAASTAVGETCPLRWPAVRATLPDPAPLDAGPVDATRGDAGEPGDAAVIVADATFPAAATTGATDEDHGCAMGARRSSGGLGPLLVALMAIALLAIGRGARFRRGRANNAA